MQRLLITIPLLVVMLSGCGNTPTDLAGPGPSGGTLGATVLDSDGDGFSDDEEINSIPGTDPFDATDNPNNVRDSDGDGCSDYDELNFGGFCDNDPNTPSIGGPACDTAYYNSDFNFGFDLPLAAMLEDQGSTPQFLLNAEWSVFFSNANVTFFAWVQDLPDSAATVDPGVLLADLVNVLLEGLEPDHDIVGDYELTLSNGDNGHMLIAVRTDIPISSYQVFTVKDNLVFTVFATTTRPVSQPLDALITEVVLSLCVD